MPFNRYNLRKLSIEDIESSVEIQSWISQYPISERWIAASMLSNIIFVSRDDYSQWLMGCVTSFPKDRKYAMYAVRKLEEFDFWDENNSVISRPGSSLGSEDLVYSLISNMERKNEIYMDHPDMEKLKLEKVRDIMLIDDSIGSGHRVMEFINSMQNNKSFLSWWSLGLLRLHIISFARSRESERTIIENVRGSDYFERKFRKSSKISFKSMIVYGRNEMEMRWGIYYKDIVGICESNVEIEEWARLGYDDTMSNIVFYHSVPDNIPGAIWLGGNMWRALFEGRSLPEWVLPLLEHQAHTRNTQKVSTYYSPTMISLLWLVKGGNRRVETIALRLSCEVAFARALFSLAQKSGLLSRSGHLTAAGRNVLFDANRVKALSKFDRSLYIPTSWCND